MRALYPKEQLSAMRARLVVAGQLSTIVGLGNLTIQRHKKRKCRLAPHCPFNAKRQARKLWIPIFKALI